MDGPLCYVILTEKRQHHSFEPADTCCTGIHSPPICRQQRCSVEKLAQSLLHWVKCCLE